jgi:hypothetical protein
MQKDINTKGTWKVGRPATRWLTCRHWALETGDCDRGQGPSWTVEPVGKEEEAELK